MTRRSFPAIRRCRRLDVHTVRRRLSALSCRKISAAWCGARRGLQRGDLFRQYGAAAGSTYTRYAVALAPCLAEKSLPLGAERVGTCDAAIFSGNTALQLKIAALCGGSGGSARDHFGLDHALRTADQIDQLLQRTVEISGLGGDRDHRAPAGGDTLVDGEYICAVIGKNG